MNKKSKQLVSGAAIALAIAGVGSNVHADETQTQAQTQETVETAKAAADTAQATATHAQEAVTAQQANVDAAQTVVNTAQADATAADKAYEQAQTDAATSTPEAIADQQSTVASAEKAVETAQNAVPKTAPTADEKPVYVLTPDDITKGEKKVDKTIEDLNAINKEITDTEAALKDLRTEYENSFEDPMVNRRLYEKIAALDKKLADAKVVKDKAETAIIEAPITADTDKEVKRDTLTVIKNEAEQALKDANVKIAEFKELLPKYEETLRNTPESQVLTRARLEGEVEHIKYVLKQLESTKANAEIKKNGAIKALAALDKPVTPDTPSETPSDKPSETKPVTPNDKPSVTDDTKPSQTVDAKATANGQVSVQAIQAAYNKVTTQKETDKVLDRRGVPTYKAATALPTTGDKESTTFAILGMTVLSLGAIGMKKRKI